MNWIYDEREVRDDVKLKLSDNWKVRVFYVTSGDTGKKYNVQLMLPTQKNREGAPISLCNCNDGEWHAVLSIDGQGQCCKHAGNLISFIREMEGRI